MQKSVKEITSSSRTKYNLSSFFLLPAIIRTGRLYKGFINSYLYNCEDDLENNNRLYVLMDYEDLYLANSKHYVGHTKVKNGWLFTFDLSKYSRNIDLFIKGKYSKFDDEFKELICNIHHNRFAMETQLYKIVYKTADRRQYIEDKIGQELDDDAELCSICNLEEEVFYE